MNSSFNLRKTQLNNIIYAFFDLPNERINYLDVYKNDEKIISFNSREEIEKNIKTDNMFQMDKGTKLFKKNRPNSVCVELSIKENETSEFFIEFGIVESNIKIFSQHSDKIFIKNGNILNGGIQFE